MFTKLEPIYRATISVLHRLGLPLLSIITGRGYHFTGQGAARLRRHPPPGVDCAGDAVLVLDALGTLSLMDGRGNVVDAGESLHGHRPDRRISRAPDPQARPRRAPIPVVLNGTVVGTGRIGRECVSIDVSYAGDPLDARHVRVAYSSYQKHSSVLRSTGASRVVPMAAVPAAP